jgi:thiol:disulfide interchange protein DsbD
MNQGLILSLLTFLFSGGLLTAQQVEPIGTESRHHTQIKLLADVQSIQPGSLFSLGLLMTMDPGWHTYWKNAGDAGLPPQIKWSLPAGIIAGEIQWPLPKKYVEGEDILTYGYERENMLIIPMTATEHLDPGRKLTIKADVDWLECEKLCIPGNGSVQIALPVKSSKPLLDNTELFAKYRKLIPGPFTSADVSIAMATSNRAVEIRLTPIGRVKVAEADFFAEAFEDIQVGRTEVSMVGDGALLKIPLALYEQTSAAHTFRGLLSLTLESGVRQFGAVEIHLSAQFVSNLRVIGKADDSSVGLLERSFDIGQSGEGGSSILLYLLFALIGGLILNIMPCVLPVIGLKVFGLIRMGGEDVRQVRKMGWYFSLGIVASFLVLALLVIALKTAGEQVGWGFQFQEPIFVVVMSTLVLVFGLSLFGVFEIRLPAIATSSVGAAASKAGAASNKELGSFSEGVLATILATPCTAPILGTALGFAFAQPAGITLVIFLAVAAGMALPYLLLTMRPGWMKLLPKPGEWMVTAKQFMGFLMMATLVWLLYILGKQLGMEAVIWTSAFMLSVALACWLIGRFATLTASKPLSRATWAASVGVCVLGYWLFLQPVLEARVVLSDESVPVGNNPAETDGILWESFSLPKLEGYLNEGKPVFIDFTAEWCLTCKVNEKSVLSDADVVDAFKGSSIISIKADWTRRNPDITRLLAKFGRSGVPLYLVFPEGRPNEPVVLPEVITSGMVIEAIKNATKG